MLTYDCRPNMKDLAPLSEAQLEVIHVVWEKGECTLGEIWADISGRKNVARNTVQTLLSRMVDKGWLDYRQVGNAFVYRATRERTAAYKQITKKFVEVAFQGSKEGLILSLLDGSTIDENEANRLRKLIDEAVARNQ